MHLHFLWGNQRLCLLLWLFLVSHPGIFNDTLKIRNCVSPVHVQQDLIISTLHWNVQEFVDPPVFKGIHHFINVAKQAFGMHHTDPDPEVPINTCHFIYEVGK